MVEIMTQTSNKQGNTLNQEHVAIDPLDEMRRHRT